MDSVIVFFANASYEQVEAAAAPLGLSGDVVTREAHQFHFRHYSRDEQLAELDVQEARAIQSLLGSAPESAFQIASHHGAAARFALERVCQLMRQFPASALDDDFGHLLSSSSVQALQARSPERGIYAARELPNENP